MKDEKRVEQWTENEEISHELGIHLSVQQLDSMVRGLKKTPSSKKKKEKSGKKS